MKKNLLVFLLYSIIAVVYTYPLVFKMGNSIYGYAGDNLGAIHYFWWWKYATLKGLPVRDSFLEQAPFGYTIDSEPGSIFYYWPLKILTLATDATFAYNLVLLLSFSLSALTMYLWVKSLVKSSLVSFWAGFAYSFSSYHFWKAYNHLDLSLLWGPPLSLFFLWKLLGDVRQGRSFWVNATLTALVTTATMLTNLYYGYFLFLTLGLLFFFSFWLFKINLRRTLMAGVVVFGLSCLAGLPFLFPSLKNALAEKGAGQSLARQISYQRPLLDLVSLSARPWDYLIPSEDNPWLGWISKKFYAWIVTRGGDFKVISGPVHERTIFLGFVGLSGLLLNIYFLLRSSEFRDRHGRLSVVLILTSLSIFIISLPPYVFFKGQTFYLPGYLLYQIAPTFRTYSRLGIFVLMLIVALAAVTFNFLFRHLTREKFIVGCWLILALSAFEFVNIPPAKVEALNLPQGLKYLSQQSGHFNFVVYPKEFNVADLLVFQTQVPQGFLNFHSQSPYSKLWEDLGDFRNPKTLQLLSALGIKYAVFQKSLVFAQPNPVDDLWYTRALGGEPGPLNAWLKLKADFTDGAVYEVEAPAEAFVVANGSRLDAFPRGTWRWAEGGAKIYFRNVGSRDAKVGLFLVKSAEESATSINYNGGLISESGGGFWLDNLRPENFVSLEPRQNRVANFSKIEAVFVN